MYPAFKPAWWLPHAHLQTLWGSLIYRGSPLAIQWERLELDDGDFLDLAWVGKEKIDSPIILILNGLTGNIRSTYIRRILKLIDVRGYRGVALQYRGTNGIPNRLMRSYHSGDTGDLQFVIDELKTREPNTPIFVIGYSMGGNILLKWLGEDARNKNLKAAAAISVPFEIGRCSDQLNLGFSKIYQWSLLRALSRAHQQKLRKLPAEQLLSDQNVPLNKIKTIRAFDEFITAPIHNFRNANDYYKQCSSRQFLSRIKVPTLILHAKDDPFTPKPSIPSPAEMSEMISYVLTEQGGHLGFVSGIAPWSPKSWMDEVILHFFEGHRF